MVQKQRTDVIILVTLEVLLFCFETAVNIYELTLSDPSGHDYRSMQFYHTLVTLILIYLALDHRRMAKGYVIAFIFVVVIDTLRAVRTTLYLTQENRTAWILNMISAYLHVSMASIITAWYIWSVCRFLEKNDQKEYYHRL